MMIMNYNNLKKLYDEVVSKRPSGTFMLKPLDELIAAYPQEEIEEYLKAQLKNAQEIENSDYEKKYFSYNDETWGPEDCFIGYGTKRKWNGWSMPCFDFETANAIMADINKQCGQEVCTYNKATDTFTLQFEDEEQTDDYEGFDIQTADGKIHVYDIGAGAWTWTEYTLDDFDEDDEDFYESFDDNVTGLFESYVR